MKKFSTILKYSSLAAVLAVGIAACNKDIEEPQRVGYSPVNVDDKAGTWKTYILASSSEIAVPAPSAVTSTEYVAELATLKGLTTNLSQKQ